MTLKLFAGLAAFVAALWSIPALAYTLGPGSGASVSSSTATASQGVVFTATFTDASGAPITNTMVKFWQQSGPPGCTVYFHNRSSAPTDSAGQARVFVVFWPNCEGLYVIAATINGGGTVTASVTEVGGFPNTSAPRPSPPAWALTAIALGATLSLFALLGLVRAPRPRH